MKQRGRKSAASLSVVAVIPRQRPEPPDSLTPEQAAIWRAVVDTKPADYIDGASEPLLTAYCRCVQTVEALGRSLDAMQIPTASGEALRSYGRLQRMLGDHTRTMLALARSLRLTQQSRYRRETAATAHERASGGPRPWTT